MIPHQIWMMLAITDNNQITGNHLRVLSDVTDPSTVRTICPPQYTDTRTHAHTHAPIALRILQPIIHIVIRACVYALHPPHPPQPRRVAAVRESWRTPLAMLRSVSPTYYYALLKFFRAYFCPGKHVHSHTHAEHWMHVMCVCVCMRECPG